MPELSYSEAFLYGVITAALIVGLAEWFARAAGEATDIEDRL